MACTLVTQLQSLVARTVDPIDSAVVTVGRIDSGTTENIIPNQATIYGTCRALRTETIDHLVAGIQRMSEHVAQAHGATAEVIVQTGYPATVNTPREARFMAEVMAESVGADHADGDVLPALTSEDFSFMLQEVPGAYGFIGNGRNGLPGVSLHNAAYDFNDDLLGPGAQFWDRLVRMWFAQDSA